jgi:ATP-dependent metalloprotease
MGATNLPEILDPALTRPGRFDRTVHVGIPDKDARKQILQLYLKSNGDSSIELDNLASGTFGFSGADLKNMVNLAGIEAVKKKRPKITMVDLDDAKEIVMMGRARPTLIVSPEVRRLTAFHEGGHALVSVYTTGGDPVYKATLVPRGGALGMVTHLPSDELLQSRESLLHNLDTAMAGRAAEELIFGKDKITGGAASDFAKATAIATSMVVSLGMSERIGPVHYSKSELEKLSPAMKDAIAEEVRMLLDTSYTRVLSLLKERKPQLEKLAHALLEKETLSIEQIKEVIQFDPKDVEPPANSTKSSFQSPLPSRGILSVSRQPL